MHQKSSWESFLVKADDGTLLHSRQSKVDPALPTCVLVHGSGEGGYVWDNLCEQLGNSYSTVIPDLRGHGDSEPSRSGHYDLATHVNDVAAVIRFFCLDRIVLIGHSLGGYIAIQLAASPIQKNVSGLVIVDSCISPNQAAMQKALSDLRTGMRIFRSIDEYAQLLLELRPFLSEEVAFRLARGALRRHESGFQLKLDPRFISEDRSSPGTRLSQALTESLLAINIPAFVMRGAASAMTSAHCANETVRLLKRGKLATISHAGHAVMSDNPILFAKHMISILSQFSALTARTECIG